LNLEALLSWHFVSRHQSSYQCFTVWSFFFFGFSFVRCIGARQTRESTYFQTLQFFTNFIRSWLTTLRLAANTSSWVHLSGSIHRYMFFLGLFRHFSLGCKERYMCVCVCVLFAVFSLVCKESAIFKGGIPICGRQYVHLAGSCS
jgi:hypothetical protein